MFQRVSDLLAMILLCLRTGLYILVSNQSGEVGLGDHVKLQADVLDCVGSSSVGSRHNDAGVVVEGELVLKAVPQGRLIEGHEGLKQFKIEWDVEPVTISICNSFVLGLCLVLIPCPDTNPIHVPVIRQVNALVLGITSFLSCPPEVPVTSVDVGVVNRQHLISRDLNRRFLHDCAADVLDHCSVGVSRCQRDRESQPRGPRHDEVVSTEVWEPD